MAKKFNIHDWQAGHYSKTPLTEGKGSTLSISKSDMEKLHKDGKIVVDGHIVLYKIEEDINESRYNRLPIRDNVMSYASQILNQINDYENNVGPGEQMIDYSGTREAVEALMGAVDRDEEGMMDEVSSTGTGTSFQAGAGMGHFGNATKKKRKKQ